MKLALPIACACVLASSSLAPIQAQSTAQITSLIKQANQTAANIDKTMRHVKPQRKSIVTGTDNGGELTILQRSNYRILEPSIGLSHWLYDWPIYFKNGKTVLVKRISKTLSEDGMSIASEKEERFYLFGDKMIYVPQVNRPLKWQILPRESKESRRILANIRFAIRGAASKDKELTPDNEALKTPYDPS